MGITGSVYFVSEASVVNSELNANKTLNCKNSTKHKKRNM
jgi:hypothetical protein